MVRALSCRTMTREGRPRHGRDAAAALHFGGLDLMAVFDQAVCFCIISLAFTAKQLLAVFDQAACL